MIVTLSHKVCRLLSSPILLRKFTINYDYSAYCKSWLFLRFQVAGYNYAIGRGRIIQLGCFYEFILSLKPDIMLLVAKEISGSLS